MVHACVRACVRRPAAAAADTDSLSDTTVTVARAYARSTDAGGGRRALLGRRGTPSGRKEYIRLWKLYADGVGKKGWVTQSTVKP